MAKRELIFKEDGQGESALGQGGIVSCRMDTVQHRGRGSICGALIGVKMRNMKDKERVVGN